MNFKSVVDPEKNEDINYINFNQDFSCFMVGTENGYKVFNTLPLLELKNFESQKLEGSDTTNSNSNITTSNTSSQNNINNINIESYNNSGRNNNNGNNTLQNSNKLNSITQGFKNLNLRNGSFQQKIKSNSILEARKNLKTRTSITNINNNRNLDNSSNSNNTSSNSNNNNIKIPNINNCPGLIIVEGLYHSNLLAIVGKDINSYFSPNKVFLCDMASDTIIAEIQYEVEVKAVRITEYGLIVVLPTQTFIYDGHVHPKCIHMIETCYNEKGLVAVATIKKKDRNGITIVLPGKIQGEIQLLNLQYKEKQYNDETGRTTPTTPTPMNYSFSSGGNDRIRRPMTGVGVGVSSSSFSNSIIPTFSKIRAHKSTLSCLAISPNGELVASASEQGTIIRIFNLESRQKIHEFRRGTDKAQIYSINFNKNCTKICVSSNKGTIHIFNLDENSSLYILQQQQQLSNDLDRNSLGYPDTYSTTTMTHYEKKHLQQQQPLSIYSLSQKIVPKYFIERSWAQFRLPLSNICTFVDNFSSPTTTTTTSENGKSEPNNKVELMALCSNGYVYRFTCITTIKTSTFHSNINSNSSKNDDPMDSLHQSHRIQKKKFYITKNEESEDEDDEDNDIIENFYNEDYIKDYTNSYE